MIDVNALIGPCYVLGKRFTLDYKRKLIAVSGTPLPQKTKRQLPMIVSPQHPGLILVHGLVNGQEVLVVRKKQKPRSNSSEEL